MASTDRIPTRELLHITGIKRTEYFQRYRSTNEGLEIFDEPSGRLYR